RPAEGIDIGLRYPDGVPRGITTAPQAVGVLQDAGRIDQEEQSTDVIVVRVEDDLDIVRADVGITTRESRAHTASAGIIVHARPDIDRRIVVRESHLGALRRRLTGTWLGLPQVGGGGSLLPDGFVQAAVEANRPLERDGPDFGGRRR